MLQLKSATKVPNDGKRFNNFLSDIYLVHLQYQINKRNTYDKSRKRTKS